MITIKILFKVPNLTELGNLETSLHVLIRVSMYIGITLTFIINIVSNSSSGKGGKEDSLRILPWVSATFGIEF